MTTSLAICGRERSQAGAARRLPERVLFGRSPAVILSLLLQLAPLMRGVAGGTTAVSPIVQIVRWLAGAAAVWGSMHAVSGATGVTLTQGGKVVQSPQGTNGIAFQGTRVTIRSDQFGTSQAYRFVGLPPGLNGSSQGVVTGVPTAAGEFPVTVTGWQFSNASGFNFFADYSVVVVEGTPVVTAPQVGVPPLAQSGNLNGTVTLSVGASGTDLQYQWIKDTSDIPGRTASSLVLSPLQPSDGGLYQVRIFNSAGSTTTTAVRVLVIVPPPVVNPLPFTLSFYEGEPLRVEAHATGFGVLNYQWGLNGVPLVGFSSPVLLRDPVEAGFAGVYSVAVTDGVGATTPGGTVQVTVVSAPILRWVSGNPGVGPSLEGETIPGRGYGLESTASLNPPAWTEVSVQTAVGTVTRFDGATTTGTRQFWRLRAKPLAQ